MNPQPFVLANGDTSIYSEALEECLKTTSQFSGSLIQNICDGTQYFIPNGFWDYFFIFVIAGVGFMFILLLFAKFLKLIFDV